MIAIIDHSLMSTRIAYKGEIAFNAKKFYNTILLHLKIDSNHVMSKINKKISKDQYLIET